jgi:hypothetical protein
MTAPELLARCRSLGIDLAVGAGGALLWEADDEPPAGLLEELAARKAELLALLAAASCPACGRALDGKGRCWAAHCGWRRCKGCGRNTGTPFIRYCLICERAGKADADPEP